MRTATSDLKLLEPRSLKHALALMRDEGPLAPLAGCTDVYVSLNFGTSTATRYLDLWPLDELRRIDARGKTLSIGALTTYTALIHSAAVRRALPALVAAARTIGGPQIQNRGTLGGNVANGSPAGDTLPVLSACDAIVVVRSASGARRIPFTEFYTGYRQSVMRTDELIVAIEFPPIEGRQWFRKVGTRAAQAISKVVMAGVRARRPRLAIGSVGPTVIRARKTEDAFASGASVADARHVLDSEITPIDDLRSTAAYRRRVAGNLLAQFWEETA